MQYWAPRINDHTLERFARIRSSPIGSQSKGPSYALDQVEGPDSCNSSAGETEYDASEREQREQTRARHHGLVRSTQSGSAS